MAKAKTQVMTDRDRAHILDPDQWPNWPYQTVKKRDHKFLDKNFGVLVATEEHRHATEGKGPFRVYIVNLFALPKGKEAWDATPRTEYATIDDLLADGWVVD